jgi:hypothetical protein
MLRAGIANSRKLEEHQRPPGMELTVVPSEGQRRTARDLQVGMKRSRDSVSSRCRVGRLQGQKPGGQKPGQGRNRDSLNCVVFLRLLDQPAHFWSVCHAAAAV